MLATAALAVGVAASPSVAKTYKFTFGTPTGGEFCDGLTISTTDKLTYSGNHTGTCEGTAQYAGGFATKIKGDGKFIDISTTDLGTPGYALTFLLDLKASTWFLYVNQGFAFQLVNEGILIKGAPRNSKRGVRSSVFKNPKATENPF